MSEFPCMQYAFLSQTICPRSAMRPLQGSEVENAVKSKLPHSFAQASMP